MTCVDDDAYDVRTEGDDIVVDTPFGTVTYTLDIDRETANERLRTDEAIEDLDLEEHWRILFETADTALRDYRGEDLIP